MAASYIAEDADLIFCLMPKPFANRSCSGLHLHLSITNTDGMAVMADIEDTHGLSNIGKQIVAGQLAHSPALAAFHAPSVNSYKSLVVGRLLSGTTWAPTHIGLGDNNRTRVLRTFANHLELDGTSNIYLAIASTIAAMLDGIEQQLTPPALIDEDVYEWDEAEFAKRNVKTLPQNLGKALNKLRVDTVLIKVLGEDFIAQYLATKTPEWVDYCRSISNWEYKHYLSWP